MAKKLTGYVHVHTEDGTKAYGPEDTVPAADAKLIVNPKAWQGKDDDEALPPPDTSGAGGNPDDQVQEPPRSGAGSGRDAWVVYAQSVGVEDATEIESRDELIAAAEKAVKAKQS